MVTALSFDEYVYSLFSFPLTVIRTVKAKLFFFFLFFFFSCHLCHSVLLIGVFHADLPYLSVVRSNTSSELFSASGCHNGIPFQLLFFQWLVVLLHSVFVHFSKSLPDHSWSSLKLFCSLIEALPKPFGNLVRSYAASNFQ